MLDENVLQLTCRSWCGFQSESKMMTVSAVCRLSPSPPALVERRKMKYSEFLSLKALSMSARSSDLVIPSRRRKRYPWIREREKTVVNTFPN